MLLAKHIPLLIGKSTVEREFRVTRDPFMFQHMPNGSPRQASSHLGNNEH